MTIILEVARHYGRYYFEHKTIEEAAYDAITQLDYGQSWPVSIKENEEEVWHQDGPFGDCIDKLHLLAGGLI